MPNVVNLRGGRQREGERERKGGRERKRQRERHRHLVIDAAFNHEFRGSHMARCCPQGFALRATRGGRG